MRFRILFFRLLFPVILLIGLAIALHMPKDTRPPPPMHWDSMSAHAQTADIADANGQRMPAQALAEAKRIVLYFPGPDAESTQAVTLRLSESYRQHGGGTAFQLLSINRNQVGRTSDDQGQDADEDQPDDAGPEAPVPWWIVRDGSYLAREISESYPSSKLPFVALLDGDGRLLIDSRGGLDAVLTAISNGD